MCHLQGGERERERERGRERERERGREREGGREGGRQREIESSKMKDRKITIHWLRDKRKLRNKNKNLKS